MLASEAETQVMTRARRRIAWVHTSQSLMTARSKALLVSALAFLVLSLVLPAVAMAGPRDVLEDCAVDGSLDGDYSRAELREALGQIESDLVSYSNCDEIIGGRLAPQAGASANGGDGSGADGGAGSGGGANGGSGAGSDGSAGATAGGDSPEERRRRELARAAVEQELGDRAFDPQNGATVNGSDATSNGLPLPTLLALIALGLLLAAGAALAIGKRNPAFMGALRRVPFPRRGS